MDHRSRTIGQFLDQALESAYPRRARTVTGGGAGRVDAGCWSEAVVGKEVHWQVMYQGSRYIGRPVSVRSRLT